MKSGREEYLTPFLAPLGIQDNSTVLDVGCGSGYVNAYLAARQKLRHNIGLDLELETVKLARQMNADAGTITWICASAEAVPLPDAFADSVVCRGVVPLATVNRVLAEASRLLRPGGTAVFLLHSWTYYLRWVSLDPRKWKRSVAGLLHFLLGLWFNLTGRQVRIVVGRHRISQTFQTEFRIRRLLWQQGMELYKVLREPEFLAYAVKDARSTPAEAQS